MADNGDCGFWSLQTGLKPRAESSCPFGVENPLRNLKLMRMGGSGTATKTQPGSPLAQAPLYHRIGYWLSAIGYCTALSNGI